MPYVQIQDFRIGMDRKRASRVIAQTGSAWTVKNGHLTRGADVERRKAFVSQGDFPASTAGLYAIDNSMYCVGVDNSSNVLDAIPSGVTYIHTPHPNTSSNQITQAIDGEGFDGELYSSLRYENGDIFHYYGNQRVTDWDNLSSNIGDIDSVASALQAAIDLDSAVGATVAGAVITVTADQINTPFTISVSSNGGSINVNQTQAPGVSAAQVEEVTISGSFSVGNQYTVVINGTSYVVTGGGSSTGTSLMTFKQKMYTTTTSNLYFSDIADAEEWVSGTDPGFINMASQTAGQETLNALAEYQGLMAIFSENNIRIWSIDEDSNNNVFQQTLQRTGTIAPNSVLSYGNNDIFYLDISGIRSIKARDSSNAAYVSDVGTAIDVHIKAYIDSLPEAHVEQAVAIIEPIDGRYWMAVGKRIYVLSYFPQAKISAWSYYELDFRVTHFARVNDRIYARGVQDDGTETLYLYGGTDNTVYPGDNEAELLVELPFMDGDNPAGYKDLNGFDIIATNEWEVKVLHDPDDESVELVHARLSGTSYNKPRIGLTGVQSLFAVTLSCDKAGAATLSALAMHYLNTSESG